VTFEHERAVKHKRTERSDRKITWPASRSTRSHSEVRFDMCSRPESV